MDENFERYYQVLNLEPTASPDEIYQAYRDLARVWDPQRFAHSPRLELKAESKLQEIIAAYHALLPSGYPGAAPGALSDSVASVALLDSEPVKPPQPPPDPFGPPQAESRPIADLHRPVDQPQTAPPVPPHVIIPADQAQTTPAAPVASPFSPAAPVLPSDSKPAADAPAGPRPQPTAKPLSRMIPIAIAAATGILVMCGAIFLYEAFSTPPPGAKLPAPVVPSSVAEVPDPGLAHTPPQPAQAQAPSPHSSGTPQRKRVRRGAAPAEERPRLLATGTELIAPQGRAGAGRFRISNRSGQDAVARVASQAAPDTALRLVYVQSATDVTVANIGPGVYFVSFSLGPLTSKPMKFGMRYGPFQFVQIQSVSGYESDQYQIVLKAQP